MRRLAQLLRFIALALPILANPAQAVVSSLTPINIAAEVTNDLTTYTGGGNYPQNGGPLAVAGINFTLATIGPQSHTAVVQTSKSTPVTLSIPISRTGVRVVYPLINSADGPCGSNIGELDFVGAHTTCTYILTAGSNVRDHYQGLYCNTATAIAGTASFGPDRLDMQQITLPAGFANDTLVRIDLKGYGTNTGAPFVAAITMDGTPVLVAKPTTSAPMLDAHALLMLSALCAALGIALMRVRQRST